LFQKKGAGANGCADYKGILVIIAVIYNDFDQYGKYMPNVLIILTSF